MTCGFSIYPIRIGCANFFLLIQVRFARHALQKMNVLTSELEVRLGPDTIDLKFRVGLHS